MSIIEGCDLVKTSQFFNGYPYTNYHEINLDFILNKINEIVNDLKTFKQINVLKYADPILWDVSKSYASNTIVVDSLTGDGYISIRPVPSGILLSNDDYWLKFYSYNFNRSEIINIYVDENGNDNNSGLDSNKPVKTLRRAYEICRKYPEFIIHEIWVKSGTYEGLQGWDLKQLSYVMRAEKGSVINITTDFAVRSGGHVLFGDWLWDGRDEAEWHFGGDGCINGIYCYGGASIVMNCPAFFDNCKNGLIADDGGTFACQERETVLTFGENILQDAVESTKSVMGLGVVKGGTVPYGYHVDGGFLTICEDKLKAVNRYNVRDGGYIGTVRGFDLPYTNKTYYVDSANGSDVNPGTKEMPVSSINQALYISRLCDKGNTVRIIVNDGVYDGIIVESFRTNITFNGNVRLTKPIVARHGASVELYGNGKITLDCGNDNCIFAGENSTIMFEPDIKIISGNNGIISGAGCMVSTNREYDNEVNIENITGNVAQCNTGVLLLSSITGNATSGILCNNGIVSLKGNYTGANDVETNGGRIFKNVYESGVNTSGSATNYLRSCIYNNVYYLSGALENVNGSVTISNLYSPKFNTNIQLVSTSGGNNVNLSLDAGNRSVTFNGSGNYVINASYIV